MFSQGPNSPFTRSVVSTGANVQSQSNNHFTNLVQGDVGVLNVHVHPSPTVVESTADVPSPSSSIDGDPTNASSPSSETSRDRPGRLPSFSPRHPRLSWLPSVNSTQSETPCSTITTSGAQGKHKCVLTSKEKKTLAIPGHPRIRQYMLSDFFFVKEVIPLWSPSPALNASESLQKLNISVGDIGAFNNDGGFDVFFNIFLSADANEALFDKLPSNFSPYPASPNISKVSHLTREDYQPRSGDFKIGPDYPDSTQREYIASYSLSNKPSTRAGSILDLPDGTYRESLFPGVLHTMSWYFDLHSENWYTFCKERKLTQGSLTFVKSVYKCKTWAIATCSTTSRGDIFARVYRKEPNTDLYGWERHGEVHPRTGPVLFGRKESMFVNQCVGLEVASVVFNSMPFHRKVKNSVGSILKNKSMHNRSKVNFI